MNRSTITVIHLVWIPFGPEMFRRFIDSYTTHPAGEPHQLLIIFNGVQASSDTKVYHEILDQSNIRYQSIEFKNGQDLQCYFDAAASIDREYILILNSYAILLSDNWLKKYLTCMLIPNTGAVGASGSWQSYYSSVRARKRIQLQFPEIQIVSESSILLENAVQTLSRATPPDQCIYDQATNLS